MRWQHEECYPQMLGVEVRITSTALKTYAAVPNKAEPVLTL